MGWGWLAVFASTVAQHALPWLSMALVVLTFFSDLRFPCLVHHTSPHEGLSGWATHSYQLAQLPGLNALGRFFCPSVSTPGL